MALQRPSLRQIIDRTVGDVQARLPGSNPLLRNSLPGVLTHAFAGAIHGVYGLLDYVGKQSNPATATGVALDSWASIWRVRRSSATFATGTVQFSGAPGAAVPEALQLQGSNGIDYETLRSAALDANGQAQIGVRSLDIGVAGNAPAETELVVVTPVAGLASRVSSVDGLAGGSDLESDERLRERLIQRISAPPHGGALHDYERWASEVAGVSQRWIVPLYDGDNSVRIWIAERSYAGTRTASAALVARVQDYVNDPSRKPVTADVTVAAPRRKASPIEIQLSPDTDAVRSAVRRELADLFARDATPEGRVLISRIREAVSIAAGESDNAVVTPQRDLSASAGEMLELGEVRFV